MVCLHVDIILWQQKKHIFKYLTKQVVEGASKSHHYLSRNFNNISDDELIS